MIRGADGLPLPYVDREGRIIHGPRCSQNTLPRILLSGDENPLTSTRCPACRYESRPEADWLVVPMVMAVLAFVLISTGIWWLPLDMAALALGVYGAGRWLERWAERVELERAMRRRG